MIAKGGFDRKWCKRRRGDRSEKGESGGVVRLGVTMAWPPRGKLKTMGRCNLRGVALADSLCYDCSTPGIKGQSNLPAIWATLRLS